MSKRKVIYTVLAVVFIFALVKIWTVDLLDLSKERVDIQIVLSAENRDEYQLFYSSDNEVSDKSFDINYSYTTNLEKIGEDDWFSFSIPADTKYIRFDAGNATKEYVIKSVVLVYGEGQNELKVKDIAPVIKHDVKSAKYDNLEGLVITTDAGDPYVIWSLSDLGVEQGIREMAAGKVLVLRIVMTLVAIGIAMILYKVRRKIFEELRELYANRRMILDLSKNDFRNKFSGSYLGVFWAFVQPIVVVTIYWFVFSVGFKSLPIDDFPYLLWLISGICPWFFFNDALNAGTTSLYDYSYIVKKVVFKISILPMVKIISCAFVHIFFIGLVTIVFCLHGEYPTWYILQAFYYSFCTIALSLGITYLTSSLAVFFKDLAQIVNIFLQFGMWMTPIMYSETTFGPKVQSIFKLNPMYYVVNGYRDSFISHVGFWEHGKLTIYFWCVTLIIFVAGILMYKKLRPHFADVL